MIKNERRNHVTELILSLEQTNGISFERLSKLAIADTDGRIIIIPAGKKKPNIFRILFYALLSHMERSGSGE